MASLHRYELRYRLEILDVIEHRLRVEHVVDHNQALDYLAN